MLKLYALNQYEEPPGILIYTTENMDSEYNATTSALHEAKKFVDEHPHFEFAPKRIQTMETMPMEDVNYYEMNPNLYRKGISEALPPQSPSSSFRHKNPGEGLIRDFTKNDFGNKRNPPHGTAQHMHTEVLIS